MNKDVHFEVTGPELVWAKYKSQFTTGQKFSIGKKQVFIAEWDYFRTRGVPRAKPWATWCADIMYEPYR